MGELTVVELPVISFIKVDKIDKIKKENDVWSWKCRTYMRKSIYLEFW